MIGAPNYTPDAKMSAVVFGSLILIITAANLFGLYSAFLHFNAISLRTNGQVRLTVDTTFLEGEKRKIID